MTRLPSLVAHADWGLHPRKRWMARAMRCASGGFLCTRSEPVAEAGRLLTRLRESASGEGAVMVGFDFPIGLPDAYARRAGIAEFKSFLREAGTGRWSAFFTAAERSDEIALTRPFYPQRPGGTKHAHLLDGLGVSRLEELRRRCERARPERPAACPLFWTLGGQQVGKAAISGWREVILPALRTDALRVGLWPFDGALETLLGSRDVVLAETYPAEFYRHLAVEFASRRRGTRSGKRVQAERARNAQPLLRWAAAAGIALHPDLETELRDGFGGGADGEDRFDAVVGLFGMLNVLLGRRPAGEPDDEAIRRIEGWILGQASVNP